MGKGSVTCKESIIDWEPVLIVHHKMPGSSIKQPTPMPQIN